MGKQTIEDMHRQAMSAPRLTGDAVAQGTPRTDKLKIPSEAMLLLGSKGVPEQIVKAILILGDHARELERENAALSAQVVELQKDEYVKGIADSVEMLRRNGFEKSALVVDRLLNQVKAEKFNSTVTRASVHPSVSDGGTTAAVIAYIDGFYVSGNSVPIDRPWINAESWGIAKELLALGLPLEHALIEQECVYRRKLRAYGNETRAKSPLQERLGMINTRTATKIEVPNE